MEAREEVVDTIGEPFFVEVPAGLLAVVRDGELIDDAFVLAHGVRALRGQCTIRAPSMNLMTEEVTESLAELAGALEEAHPPQAVADFLMRCLFTMFAEHVGLPEECVFTKAMLDQSALPLTDEQ